MGATRHDSACCDTNTISKGPSPVTHPAVGDAATTEGSTRRKVLGAGLIGAALALTATRSAVATSEGALSEADLALLGFDQGFELAARDLYDAAIAGGADDPLMETLSEQHEAYAQAIAGLTGIPANQRNDDVFDEFSAGFSSGGLGDVLQSAYDLEATAAATQVELIAELVDVDSAKLYRVDRSHRSSSHDRARRREG